MSGAIARMKSPPQSFWLVGSVGLNAAVSLLSIPLFVELLSHEDLATLAQAGAIALAVSTICSLGANTIGPHIATGKLDHLKSYDELLGNQLFMAVVLFGLLALPAFAAGLSAETLGIFACHFAAGVSSAVSPNWLMVQRGAAQKIFAYHLLGRALYVGVLVYFALVGGGLLLASVGILAGSLLTTTLVFRSLSRELPIGFAVVPIRAKTAHQALTVMSSPLATALFASVAPFVLQNWIGLAAVGLYYVVERARVFVSEIVRTAEAPFYQAVARDDGKVGRADAAAMPFAAVALAVAFPLLVAWGPKLAVIQMLEVLWPYLSAYCLALALSTRAVTFYVEGRRRFGGGAFLRIAATALGVVTMLVLCATQVELAYALAIVAVEVALALAAVAYSRGGRG